MWGIEMKVTLEGIKAKIKSETYLVLPDGRTTLCMLTLENGYTIKGLSACVDPAEFNLDQGRFFAFEDALRQIWPLEGYLLAEKMYWDNAVPVATNPPKKIQLSNQRIRAMMDAGVWKTKTKRNAIIAKFEKSDASHGRKKDGTPKQKPGRKAA